MSALRGLLREQSDKIMASQQTNLDKAIKRIDREQVEMFGTIHNRLDSTNGKVEALEEAIRTAGQA